MTRLSLVYFLKPIGLEGPIKIGCSTVPHDRLETLGVWSPFPLELLVTIPGDFRVERNIHQCFADAHSHREWFRATHALQSLIIKLKDGVPLADAIDLTARKGSIRLKVPRTFSDVQRTHRSIISRLFWAVTKYEQVHSTRIFEPDDVTKIKGLALSRLLTEPELSRIAEFVGDVGKHGLTYEQKWPKPRIVPATPPADQRSVA